MTDLANRAISSISWNLLATFARGGLLLVRFILLARWLPVAVFGTYGFALSLIRISSVLPSFGLGGAFLHRATETENESKAAEAYFTLNLISVLIWAFFVAVASFVLAEGSLRTALIWLTVFFGGLMLTAPAKYILIRRVDHKRLAFMQIMDSALSTVIALALAYSGFTLWALLSADLVAMSVSVLILYFWRPIWRPSLRWHSSGIRYFLNFGIRSLIADILESTLDQVDNLWTGFFLGELALGFYNRAYAFAVYPRRLILAPVKAVLSGAYAELKNERNRLSQAVSRSQTVLIRLSFWAGGLLYVIAPEFILVVLTSKWLPMLDAFRFMLIFAVLDPYRKSLGDLFIAVGRPQELTKSRSIQLVILAGGLFALGPKLGIVGVALAVNLALLVGLFLMLHGARVHVDFSLAQLFAVPCLSLITGIGLTLILTAVPWFAIPTWQTGVIKAIFFSTLYCGFLVVLERKKLAKSATQLIKDIRHLSS